jgi:hypothetical protein
MKRSRRNHGRMFGAREKRNNPAFQGISRSREAG